MASRITGRALAYGFLFPGMLYFYSYTAAGLA
jgi:hypothetical protein